VPLYEYQCKKCKHKFEKIQKFSDPPIKKCPECGGPVEKLLHAPAVQFKGTGWYVTDYAGKNKMETSKTESSSGSEKKESTGKEDGAKSKDKDSSPKKSESKKSESKKSKD
jgi:putative FmdB family regulatory protein